MNLIRETAPPVSGNLAPMFVPPARPQLPAASLTRAGLPVVSNRAFIAAWSARRARLPAVRLVRSR